MTRQRENDSNPAHVPEDPETAALEAAGRLRAALEKHGVKFPSLRGGYPVAGRAFVELGGCSASVALALAEVLEKAEADG
jgi:hypothetical protein